MIIPQADLSGSNVLPGSYTTMRISDLYAEEDYNERWSKFERSLRRYIMDEYQDDVVEVPQNVNINSIFILLPLPVL